MRPGCRSTMRSTKVMRPSLAQCAMRERSVSMADHVCTCPTWFDFLKQVTRFQRRFFGFGLFFSGFRHHEISVKFNVDPLSNPMGLLRGAPKVWKQLLGDSKRPLKKDMNRTLMYRYMIYLTPFDLFHSKLPLTQPT